MRKHVLLPILLLGIGSTAGCVTKKAHRAVQEDLDRARGELQGAHSQSASLEQALEEERKTVADLESEVANLEKKVASLEQELADTRAGADADMRKLEGELSQVVKDRSSLRASIKEMKDALADARARKQAAERRVAEYQDLLTRFKDLIDAGRLQVKIVDGRMVVVLSMDILFDSGSARLSEEGAKTVGEITTVLADIPDKRYQIEGHTDTVPINTQRYPSNWELGAARALSIVKKMVEAGMPPERVSGATYGEFHPTTTNDTEEGKAKNRRIEIVVVPDLSNLPGAEELERMTK